MAKILVIDDEAGIRMVTRKILEKAGNEVTEAETGEEALEMLTTGRPDVILLDIMLPGIDGWEVLRRIKADPSLAGIPVAMFSVKGEEEDILTSFRYDADLHIPKPFDRNLLVDAVEGLLG